MGQTLEKARLQRGDERIEVAIVRGAGSTCTFSGGRMHRGLARIGSVVITAVACTLPPPSEPPVPVPEEGESASHDVERRRRRWLGHSVVGPVPPGGPPVACGLQRGELVLNDGGLRCRELPFEISFPPGTTVSRSDNDYRTTFVANLAGESLTMMVERIHARGVVCELDFCHFETMNEQVLHQWLAVQMGGGVGERVQPPRLPAASLSLGLRHDAHQQVVRAHGYVIDGWLVTLVARGDGRLGSAFLDSIVPRDVDHSAAVVELARRGKGSDWRVSLELPRSFWSADQFLPEPTDESTWIFELPSSARMLEVHVDTSTVCESPRRKLARAVHLNEGHVRVRRGQKTSEGLYYETRVKNRTAEVWYTRCHDERVWVALGLSDGVSTADELEVELRTYVATLTIE